MRKQVKGKSARQKTPPLPIPDTFFGRRPFWGLFLCGLAVDLILETLCRHSLLSALRFAVTSPHLFLYNALIVAMTYSFVTVVPRRAVAMSLASFLWLGLGAADFVVTLFRKTPLSFIDLVLLPYVKSVVTYYVSWPVLILALAAIAALIVLAIVRLARCRRYEVSPRQAICLPTYALIVFALTVFLIQTGLLPDHYDNLITAYEQNGFAYCFTRSLIDRGISEPETYSPDEVDDRVEEIESGEEEEQVELRPSIVFVQLESFFRPERLKGLPEGECDLPVFSSLLANCPSGGLTVPVFGGGTVNTEFEVLTGMSVRDFGTGEFPYHTVLQNMPCESICYNLRELGYTSHAIHDNTAIFYNRFKVFANLGFDTFTSIEYMNGVTYNPIGWAKDKTMLPYVTEALDSTDGPDFIQVITVQPHGSYPDDEDLPPADLDAEGFEEEDARRAFAYYLTQLEEEDAFIGELIRGLSARSEPIVVVLYGDHLPAFAITDDMLLDGDVYRSEYAIWSNFDLGGEKKDLSAYQLSAYVMELLGFDNGLLTRLHQHYMQEGEDYAETLKLLEYDMIYGEQTVYGGEFPYKPTDLHMGLSEITVDSLRAGEKILSIYGENFTKSSYVYVNGDRKHTEFVSPGELLALASAEAGDLVTVAQLSNGEPVGETEPCLVELDERDEG